MFFCFYMKQGKGGSAAPPHADACVGTALRPPHPQPQETLADLPRQRLMADPHRTHKGPDLARFLKEEHPCNGSRTSAAHARRPPTTRPLGVTFGEALQLRKAPGKAPVRENHRTSHSAPINANRPRTPSRTRPFMLTRLEHQLSTSLPVSPRSITLSFGLNLVRE